jgi:hypothetical protein
LLTGGPVKFYPAAPWSGATTTLTCHTIAIQGTYFPFTGWRASPALGSMHGLNPDFIGLYSEKDMKSIFSGKPENQIKVIGQNNPEEICL